jgi:hypothetical protein
VPSPRSTHFHHRFKVFSMSAVYPLADVHDSLRKNEPERHSQPPPKLNMFPARCASNTAHNNTIKSSALQRYP